MGGRKARADRRVSNLLSTLAIKLICVEVLGRYELQLVEGQDLSECNDTALPVPTSGLRVRLRARE